MLIYDCEILRMIPDRDGGKDPRYQYCNGWDDFPSMGISVIGLWATTLDGHMMTITNPNDSIPLNAAQGKLFEAIAQRNGPVVGFNSRRFDDNLCLANNIPIRTDQGPLLPSNGRMAKSRL